MFKTANELIPGVWTDDIRDHPNDIYTFTYRDYNCKIARNKLKWAWNGYCQIPPTHPFYGKDYDDVKISVHGGLTYGDPDGWFGFDCAHFGDISPADATILADPTDNPLKRIAEISKSTSSGREKYWTFDDVKKEIEHMVEQFQGMEQFQGHERVEDIERFEDRGELTKMGLSELLSALTKLNAELLRREKNGL